MGKRNKAQNVSGMNVEGMGGIGSAEAQKNIHSILANSQIANKQQLSSHDELLKSNGQKGNLS